MGRTSGASDLAQYRDSHGITHTSEGKRPDGYRSGADDLAEYRKNNPSASKLATDDLQSRLNAANAKDSTVQDSTKSSLNERREEASDKGASSDGAGALAAAAVNAEPVKAKDETKTDTGYGINAKVDPNKDSYLFQGATALADIANERNTRAMSFEEMAAQANAMNNGEVAPQAETKTEAPTQTINLTGSDQVVNFEQMERNKEAGERVGKVIGGSLQNAWAGVTNTVGTMAKAGANQQGFRDEELAAAAKAMGVSDDDVQKILEANFASKVGANSELGQSINENVDKFADKTFDYSDKVAEKGQTKLAEAKEGVGTVGQVAIDLGSQAVNMAVDGVINLVIPGSGLVSMGARVFGDSARELRDKGYSIEDQMIAGTKSAAIEILSEKIAGPFEKIYGKTALGKVTTKAIDKITESATGRMLLKNASNFLGEGFEEIASDVLNTIFDHILGLSDSGNTLGADLWSDEAKQQYIYDGLIGGLMGFLGGAVENINWNALNPEQKLAAVHQATDQALREADKGIAAQQTETAPTQQTAADAIAETAAPTEAAVETKAEPAKVTPTEADITAVEEFLTGGTFTEQQARNTIVKNDAMRAAFEQVTGISLNDPVTGEKLSNNKASKLIVENFGKDTATTLAEQAQNTAETADLTEATKTAQNEEIAQTQENIKPTEQNSTQQASEELNSEQNAENAVATQNEAEQTANEANTAEETAPQTEASTAADTLAETAQPTVFKDDPTIIKEQDAQIKAEQRYGKKQEKAGMELALEAERKGTKDTNTAMKLAEQAEAKGIKDTQKAVNRESKAGIKLAEETQKAGEKAAQKAARQGKAEGIAQAMQRAKDRTQRAKERKQRTETINAIKKSWNKMASAFENPSVSKYVPKDMIKSVGALLDSVNMDTVGSESKLAELDAKLAETKYGTEEHTKLMAQRDNVIRAEERQAARFDKFQEAYSNLKDDMKYAGMYDGVVDSKLAEVRELVGDTPLKDMTAEQLSAVQDAFKAVQKQIENNVKGIKRDTRHELHQAHNRFMTEVQQSSSFAEADRSAVDSVFGRKAQSLKNRIKTGIETAADVWNNPRTMFNILGGRHADSQANYEFEQFHNGEKVSNDLLQEGYGILDPVIKDTKNLRTLRQEVTLDNITDADGNPIKMSRGMMLNLYMAMKDPQQRMHIMRGGFVSPEIDAYYGKYNDKGLGTTRNLAFGSGVELANQRAEFRNLSEQREALLKKGELEQASEIGEQMLKVQESIDTLLEQDGITADAIISEIESKMTNYDWDFTTVAREFMDWAKEHIEQTTLDVYGFTKEMVQDNYWTINTAKEYGKTSLEDIASSLNKSENWGNMKARSNATNPVLMLDISDVCETYLRNMSKYCGIMPAVKNFNAMWNMNSMVDTKSGGAESLKAAIMDKYGKAGVKYVEDYIADLQGGRGGLDTNIFSRLRGNMASAALTLNPGVAAGQTGSLLSAAKNIDAQHIARAVVDSHYKNQAAREAVINKYSSNLFLRLHEGGVVSADANVAKRIDKKLSFLTGWITGMDRITVNALWDAAEYQVEAKNPNLRAENEDAFYKEVAKLWDSTVEETQPDNMISNKPAALRSTNEAVKTMTMFMTQRLKNWNNIYNSAANMQQAAQDVKNAKTAEEKAAAVKYRKEAASDLGRSVGSVVASSAFYTLIRMGVKGLMHDWDKFRDDETGEVTAEAIGEEVGWYFAETLIGTLPLGNIVSDIIETTVRDKTYYGFDSDNLEALNDMVGDTIKLIKASVKDGDVKSQAVELLKDGLTAAGIPAENAIKLYDGIKDWYDTYSGVAAGEDFSEAAFDYTKRQQSNRIIDHFLDGDTDTADELFESMPYIDGKQSKTAQSKEVRDTLMTRVKARYLSTDEGIHISREEALKVLTNYCYDSEDEANAKLDSWETNGEYADSEYKKQAEENYNALVESFKTTDAYAGMTNAQRAETMGKIGTYADELARAAYGESIGEEYHSNLLENIEDSNYAPMDYIVNSVSTEKTIAELESAVKKNDVEGIETAFAALQEFGKKDSTIQNKISSTLEGTYVGGTIDLSQTKKYLKEYCGMTDEKIDKTIKEWNCEKNTGIKYSEIKERVLLGAEKKNGISVDKATSLMSTYGDYEADEDGLYTKAELIDSTIDWWNYSTHVDRNTPISESLYIKCNMSGIPDNRMASICNSYKAEIEDSASTYNKLNGLLKGGINKDELASLIPRLITSEKANKSLTAWLEKGNSAIEWAQKTVAGAKKTKSGNWSYKYP